MTNICDELFVLELANNHWGKVDRGLKIIDDFAAVVKENGVKASIKLQFRDVDAFIHPDYHGLTDFRYIKKTRDTHMSWDNLRRLVDRVVDHDMLTMVTPFDEVSVDKCVEFGVDILKIASSDIRDKTLLHKLASTGKPIVASSGGADLHHIDNLVQFFADRHIPFTLNHCVSLYPSEDSDVELNQIDFLRARYPDIVIGLSSHEHRDWHNSVMMAYAKGARTFERHVDIDYEGVPVSSYCTRPEQADVWFKAFLKAKEMCGGPATAKRTVPAKEREYLDALVRGAYVRHDLPAGHVLTDADVMLAVPLLKGQISTREYEGGEVLKTSLRALEPINLVDIEAAYVNDPEVCALVPDRGYEPHSVEICDVVNG